MAKKISKKTAKKWADKFKAESQGKGASSSMFTKQSVLDILNQSGCEGLRVYNGYDDDNPEFKYTMFLVGTDASGRNLLPANDESVEDQYFIEDDSKPCPPVCPPNDL